MQIKKLIIIVLLIICNSLLYAQKSDTINKYDTKDLKTGKWVGHWNETGKTSYIEYYVEGKKNGICIYYDINGRLLNEIDYINDSINGEFKFYSPNGQKEIAEFKDGKREGFTRYYNYKGQLVEEFEYHNNIRNGIHRIYSESGRVTMESPYVNGRENGTRRTYKDKNDKEIILEADFINDKRVEIRYYKKGKLVKSIKDDPSIEQKPIQ